MGRKERRREHYGEPASVERGWIVPYILAGIAYIGCGLIYPGILYSSFTGMLFLLALVWGLPWLWRRFR